MNIAVVGHHSRFCLQLQELLESQNHLVTLLPEVEKAFARLSADPVHLVVINGVESKDAALELLRTMRGHAPTRQVPALVVNPKGTAGEVVELLDVGADDYLARPFNGQIFLARVRTLLRRQIWSGGVEEEPVTVLQAGALNLHLVERTVQVETEELVLTRLEFELLAFLVRNKDKVLKRSEILESVWKYPQNVETRTLDKHVETLRKKLGPVGKQLRTVHAVGYRFLDPKTTPVKRKG